MTQVNSKTLKYRGQIFPEIQWTEEEVKQYQAKKEAFHKRCRAIFEKISPSLIK